MSGIEIRLLFYALLVVAVAGAVKHYLHLQEQAALGAQRHETLNVTGDILDHSGKTRTVRQQDEGAVRHARDTYQRSKNNDPPAGDRDTVPVPASVRQRFHERRLARERFGSPTQ